MTIPFIYTGATIPLPGGGTTALYNFDPTNVDIILEAFDRIQIRPQLIQQEHMLSARISINLELQSWSIRGVNLWEMVTGTIAVGAGVQTYTLPAQMQILTELLYSVTTSGTTTDTFMSSLTRTQWAQIPVKGTQGPPTQYWYQRLSLPQVTIYPNPSFGGTGYNLTYFGTRRVADANFNTIAVSNAVEGPDVPYRAYEALIAGLAARLAEKYAPEQWETKRAAAKDAWNELATFDQENGPLILRPNTAPYGKM